MEKQKSKQRQNGITLIALVVTIIVLIILAGVSINMLVGDNGIVTQAQRAQENTELAKAQEKEDMGKIEDEMNETITEIEVEQVTDENPGVLENEGTDTYIINSIEDLVFFAYDVTNGNKYEGQTVKLGVSLNFNSTKSYVDAYRTNYGEYGYDGELKTLLTTGEGFKPIGTIYDADISTNYFEGTFDGNGNAIYNLYQNIENSEYATIIGFFSTNAGRIDNLRLENANISATTNNMHIVAGVICGRNKGNIINCGSSGNLNITDNGVKSNYGAGITGQAMGIVERCFSKTNIDISSNNSSSINIAGIAGALTEGYIKACYNIGTMNINLNADISIVVGGISGNNSKKVEYCYNTGNINLISTSQTTKLMQIGNIVGLTNANAETNNCFNIGQINLNLLNDNETIYIGNIVGDTYRGNISNCYNVGEIKLNYIAIQKIGQIAGRAHSSIFNDCFGIIEKNITVIGSVETENTINNVVLIEKNGISNILEVIGEDFENDSENINQGYPILKWEHENL